MDGRFRKILISLLLINLIVITSYLGVQHYTNTNKIVELEVEVEGLNQRLKVLEHNIPLKE